MEKGMCFFRSRKREWKKPMQKKKKKCNRSLSTFAKKPRNKKRKPKAGDEK